MDMQSEMWAWLFRRVPAEQHNQIVLMTRSGTEIAVQALLRIEERFLAIKGRLVSRVGQRIGRGVRKLDACRASLWPNAHGLAAMCSALCEQPERF